MTPKMVKQQIQTLQPQPVSKPDFEQMLMLSIDFYARKLCVRVQVLCQGCAFRADAVAEHRLLREGVRQGLHQRNSCEGLRHPADVRLPKLHLRLLSLPTCRPQGPYLPPPLLTPPSGLFGDPIWTAEKSKRWRVSRQAKGRDFPPKFEVSTLLNRGGVI
jgi:hypothetical protein